MTPLISQQLFNEVDNLRFTLFAAAMAAAFTGHAAAQSSVTLQGIVDVGVGQVRNTSAGKSVRVNEERSNGLNGSQIRISGQEDLGGGLNASFWLEAGINPDTGTMFAADKFWNRRSTVSLAGSWGEIRLGRTLAPTFRNFADFDPTGNSGIAQGFKIVSALGSGAATMFRTDNTVEYVLPRDLGGFYGMVSVAPGEGAPGNEYAGARIGYASGPLNVAIAHGSTETTPGKPNYQLPSVGAAYKFDSVTLMGYYGRPKFGALQQKVWLLGARASVGAGEVWALYERGAASGGDTDGDDATNLGLGYVHHLSRRTALYGSVARVSNRRNAAFKIPSSNSASARGGSSQGFELGLRHFF